MSSTPTPTQITEAEPNLQAEILAEARALQAALKTDQDLIDLLRGFKDRNNDQAQKNAFADALGERGWWLLADVVQNDRDGDVYYDPWGEEAGNFYLFWRVETPELSPASVIRLRVEEPSLDVLFTYGKGIYIPASEDNP